MKITAAAVSAAILGLLPLAQSSSLRLQHSQFVQSTSEAQIIINGVLRDFSNEDLSIIGQSAIGAYNSVYRKSGFSLEYAKPLLHFGVPDSVRCDGCRGESKAIIVAVGTACDGCEGNTVPMAEVGSTCDGCEEHVAPMVKIGATCDGCEELVVPMVKVGSTCDGCERAHETFVTNFCERIADSGSSNLANAHHCSFSFLGHKSAPVEVESHNAQAFLSVNDLLHDLTQKDMAIIDESAMDAYNEAFSTNSDRLMSLKTRVSLDVPSVDSMCDGCARSMCDGCARATCDGCAPEGKTLMADVQVGSTCDGCASNFMSLMGIGAACDGCSANLEYANIAMTKAFCAKLRNSGSANLANAHGCGLKFVHA